MLASPSEEILDRRGPRGGRAVAVPLAFLAFAVGACSDVALDDNLDLPSSPQSELHTPYAVGTRVQLRANQGEDAAELRVESRSPSVFNVLARHGNVSEFLAVREGTADVAVVLGSETLLVEQIEVRAPDSARIEVSRGTLAALPLPDSEGAPSGARLTAPAGVPVVASFTCDTGQVRLYGSGAVVLEAPENVRVSTEWAPNPIFEISAPPGEHTLRLVADDTARTVLGAWTVAFE